jgi:hypothetical protein
LYLSKETTK